MRQASFITFQWVRCAILAAAFGLSFPVAQAETPPGAIASQPATNDWSFDIVPYLWLAGYEGTIGLSGPPAGIPQVHSESADPFTTHISAAAMFTAQVSYRQVGLMFDGAWLQLKTEGEPASSSFSGTEMKSDIAYGTLALAYGLPVSGKLQTTVFTGARLWFISNELDLQSGTAPGFTTSSSRNWADPLLGAHLRYDLTRHWFCSVLGDVGGFGVGSDITWSVFGGVGYQFTDWCSARLGYRYLHVDYDKDQFLMNVDVQGFLVGLGFHF